MNLHLTRNNGVKNLIDCHARFISLWYFANQKSMQTTTKSTNENVGWNILLFLNCNERACRENVGKFTLFFHINVDHLKAAKLRNVLCFSFSTGPSIFTFCHLQLPSEACANTLQLNIDFATVLIISDDQFWGRETRDNSCLTKNDRTLKFEMLIQLIND